MSQILGLRFSEHGQLQYFDSGALVVDEGEHVIVQTEAGLGMGTVVAIHEEMPKGSGGTEGEVQRVATDDDLQTLAENRELAREAMVFCKQKIRERDLEMKLVDVEVFFDKGKILFYFTAPGRVDFRELVKDLVKQYRSRIELRQIGVRHETQMVGAVGNCGMVCCCRRYLRKFAPVTIKMAKEQNLFLNPSKISGICGRLLCCLAYEQDSYERFHKKCPKIGKKYMTTEGLVKVLRANLFRNALVLLTERNEELEVELEEWEAMEPERPDPAVIQQHQQAQQQRQQAAREKANAKRPPRAKSKPQKKMPLETLLGDGEQPPAQLASQDGAEAAEERGAQDSRAERQGQERDYAKDQAKDQTKDQARDTRDGRDSNDTQEDAPQKRSSRSRKRGKKPAQKREVAPQRQDEGRPDRAESSSDDGVPSYDFKGLAEQLKEGTDGGDGGERSRKREASQGSDAEGGETRPKPRKRGRRPRGRRSNRSRKPSGEGGSASSQGQGGGQGGNRGGNQGGGSGGDSS